MAERKLHEQERLRRSENCLDGGHGTEQGKQNQIEEDGDVILRSYIALISKKELCKSE